MKRLFILIFLDVAACTSKPASEADLAGKTFQARHTPDEFTENDDANEKGTAELIAGLRYEYAFYTDGSGKYTIVNKKLPTIKTEMPFDWSLMADSLTINVKKPGLNFSNKYKINAMNSGLQLRAASTTIDLIPTE